MSGELAALLKGREPLSEHVERLLNAYAWIQEHANLCTVCALSGCCDEETRGRMRLQLVASLERGTHLVEHALDEVAKHPEVKSVPSASPSRGPISKPFIPLSGAHRFDERKPFGRADLCGSTQPPENTPQLSPSRTYMKK